MRGPDHKRVICNHGLGGVSGSFLCEHGATHTDFQAGRYTSSLSLTVCSWANGLPSWDFSLLKPLCEINACKVYNTISGAE